MPEKENIEKVLSELRSVLKGLTGEEPVETPSPAKPVPRSEPEVPAAAAPPREPAPMQESAPAKSAPPQPAPGVSPAYPPPAPRPSNTQPQSAVAETPRQPAPAPAVKTPPAAPAVPSKDIMRYAVFYTQDQSKSKEQFLLNLSEFMKKTSKKPISLEKVADEPLDVFSVNWEGLCEKAKADGIETVFLIHGDNFDSVELKSKFAAFNLFFEGIQESRVNKKITYIDLVIELMLAKK